MKKLLLFGALLLMLCTTGKGQINTEQFSYIARTRIYFGNFTGAIDYLNLVIRVRPNLPEPYFLRGVAKQFLEDYRGAKIDLNKAIEIKPFFSDAYLHRAMVEYELKEFKSSMDDYSRAIELNPEDDNFYNNRGVAKAAMKDTLGAIADYDKALQLNPQNINSLLNRSSLKLAQKDYKGTIADIDLAIKVKPSFAGAYLERGIAEFAMNDYANALSDYDECIYNDPENALAYNNRGIVKHKLGDFEGAIMDYDKTLELDPTMANAYMNRGIAKAVLHRKDFMKDFQAAARLDSRYAQNPYLVQANPRAFQQSQIQQQQQQNQNARKVGSTKAAPGGSGMSDSDQSKATAQNQTNKNQATQSNNNQSTDNKEKTPVKKRKNKIITVINGDEPAAAPSKVKENEDSKKIQNKNIEIKLQPVFSIATAFHPSEQNERMQYYSPQIEKLNEMNHFDPFLGISNKDFNDKKYEDEFENNIRFFSAKLKINAKISNNYLGRAIFESLTSKYNDAINDYNKAIDLDSQNTLAYFGRANTQSKMVDIILSLPDFSEHQQEVFTLHKRSGQKKSQTSTPKQIHDYDQILRDYQKVIELNPRFVFALFNRANIYCKIAEYDKAEADYNRVIELNPDFAEAYFNRGLICIYKDEIEKAALNLSKAGELGIPDAYNVIKRYCN